MRWYSSSPGKRRYFFENHVLLETVLGGNSVRGRGGYGTSIYSKHVTCTNVGGFRCDLRPVPTAA